MLCQSLTFEPKIYIIRCGAGTSPDDSGVIDTTVRTATSSVMSIGEVKDTIAFRESQSRFAGTTVYLDIHRGPRRLSVDE